MNKNLKELLSQKQSIWYDDLSKELLETGKLSTLLNSGVRGLTSNPSIFEKAITSSELYNSNIQEIKDPSPQTILDQLMINDVANAADLMLEIYQESNALDGYASLEVSPTLADKTEETISAAKDYWQRLNRPNIMIKVPATPAGIPAIEELIAAGININVTLIFSTIAYQEVIKAYQNGLARRLANGESIDKIHSVASFFISRVDAWVENNSTDPKLTGKVGIANGLKAYDLYKQEFSSKKFEELKRSGANIQRILWASTSTKNKSFDPLLYAASLPLEDTVATHPPALIEMISNLEESISNHQEEISYNNVFLDFDQIGLSQEKMFQELLEEGVDKFTDAYNRLLDAIREKKSA